MKSKKVWALGCIIMLAFLLVGCPGNDPTPTDDKLTITGVVHFPSNSYQPQAKVYLDESRTTITGSNGTFSFDNVEPGTHTLRIDSALYGSQIYEFDFTEDATVDLDPLLVKAQSIVSGDGQVQLQVEPTFPEGATQVRLALSTSLTSGYQELTTSGTGTITHDITDSTDPDQNYYLQLTYVDQNNTTLKILYSSIAYEPPVGLSVPAAGAEITDGAYFDWGDVPNATYQLTISSNGYRESTGVLNNSAYTLGDPFTLNHQSTYQWQVTAIVTESETGWPMTTVNSPHRSFIYSDGQERANITGTVHFSEGNTGTVAVVYLDETQSVVTNSDGTFTFTDLLLGNHTLRVDSATYGSDYVTVDLTTGGASVDLDAATTSVVTLVDPNAVRIMVSPVFPEGVESIQVEFSDSLTGAYQLWDTIPKGDLYVKEVSGATQPDQKYYLRFTYLDQNDNIPQQVYNCFYYYTPISILAPADGATVNDQTQFSWSEIPGQAQYQVRIMSTDFSYASVSNFLTSTELTLGDQFTLTTQDYTWEVSAQLLDGTDNFINDVRLKIRSASHSFTY